MKLQRITNHTMSLRYRTFNARFSSLWAAFHPFSALGTSAADSPERTNGFNEKATQGTKIQHH